MIWTDVYQAALMIIGLLTVTIAVCIGHLVFGQKKDWIKTKIYCRGQNVMSLVNFLL